MYGFRLKFFEGVFFPVFMTIRFFHRFLVLMSACML